LYLRLSKKAGDLDLNDYTHVDRVSESTPRKRPVFNPEDLSRALADLAVSCAPVTVPAKLAFRIPDLQAPWF